ncbi:hypothetical protein GCM10020295_08060 [Streptomyces cinereospinus]
MRHVRDLSPGLGQSAVLGVTAEPGGAAEPERWIVKIPGFGHRSGLDSRDPSLEHREALFLGGAPGCCRPASACPPTPPSSSTTAPCGS